VDFEDCLPFVIIVDVMM